MKTLILPLLAAVCFAVDGRAQVLDPSPTNGVNIVQNGTFRAFWDHWQGNAPAFIGDPQAPNGVFAAVNDIYQFIPTIPGQSYLVSFYAAADLYYGPSVSIGLYLNNQQATVFTTPPYAYTNGRYDHWQLFTYTFTASTWPTRLEFIDLNTYAFGLANVSAIATGAPPTLICSMPLKLASASDTAIGTVSVEVQNSSGAALAIVWTVDGGPCQTNFISQGGAPIHTNLTLTAPFTLGEHVVTVSASDGHTSPSTCSTTVTVYPCSLPNLIVNGSFENGYRGWTGTIGLYQTPNPVSGRTVGVVTDISHSSVNQCGSQTIATEFGAMYEIRFGIRLPELFQISPGVWVPVAGDSSGASTTIQLQWNDRTIRSIPVTSREWTFHSVSVVATTPESTLTFYNGLGSRAWPFVDAVSVTPVAQLSAMICPDPLVLECTNGSAVGTIAIAPPAACENAQAIVWTVNGVPYQTNNLPSGGASPPTNVTFTANFELGEHLVLASASTGQSNSTTCSTTVTVHDTTRPVVSILGSNPMTNECHTAFTDPGAVAVDACAGPLGISVSSTVDSDSPGVYSISYSATDPSGNTTTSTRTVYIVDTTPPRILRILAKPNVLWPPNHRMIRVRLGAVRSDSCDPSTVARITKVTCNQPRNQSAPDWEITGPLSVDLRAERSGKGGDRIYTLFVEVADSSGNKTVGTIPVTVPHAQSDPRAKLWEAPRRDDR